MLRGQPDTTLDGARSSPVKRGAAAALAAAVFLVASSAGVGVSMAWRASLQHAAHRQFQRQAAGAQHHILVGLTQTADVEREMAQWVARQPTVDAERFDVELDRDQFTRRTPGGITIGYVTRAADGRGVDIVHDHSVYGNIGVDLSLRRFLPGADAMLDASEATGRPSASQPVYVSWGNGAPPQPLFLVATPVPGTSRGWIVTLVFGNWIVRNALDAARSGFRAELRDGASVVAADFIPVGPNDAPTQRSIPADAPRSVTHIAPFGRTWTLVVTDAARITVAQPGKEQEVVLVAGGILAMVLAGLVWVLARSRARALQHVERATAELQTSEARFRSLVQYGSDAVVIVDPAGVIQYASSSAERLFGWRPDDLLSQPLSTTVHPEDQLAVRAMLEKLTTAPAVSAEHRVRHNDGTWRDVETVAANFLDLPAVNGFVLTIRDISDRKSLEDELRHQAFHDPLTGLANRALFTDRVHHALSRRHNRSIALMFCDLDDFKDINDSLGHAAGDAILMLVANRLRSCLRDRDTAARLGGDEFAALLEDIPDVADVRAIADRLIGALREPVIIDGQEVHVTASIGIVHDPQPGDDPDILLQRADRAMYLAKSGGKGRYQLFEPTMNQRVPDRRQPAVRPVA